MKNIFKIADTVEKILREQPETRDDDKLLILKVWAEQNPELRNPNFNFLSFGEGFLRGRYANPESIRRSRQKIQEHMPELAGTKNPTWAEEVKQQVLSQGLKYEQRAR